MKDVKISIRFFDDTPVRSVWDDASAKWKLSSIDSKSKQKAFMEGNGRSMRIWLDLILKKNLSCCVDWSKINKKDYLAAMEKSVLDEMPVLDLIQNALTDRIDDREMFMKGIDYSYYYETEE